MKGVGRGDTSREERIKKEGAVCGLDFVRHVDRTLSAVGTKLSLTWRTHLVCRAD